MKKKYLIKFKFLFKLYLHYFGFKYKILSKKSYSQFGEDLIIDKFFGSFIGRYVDIGCFHPIKYNNTALLHKKGWSGYNIDLNPISIDLFNVSRKKDQNIIACLSDIKDEVTVYIDNQFSALNSMSPENSKNFKFKNIKKIKVNTQLFSEVVKENFDFLNIDCEGNDYKILKTINLKKYTPEIINIEVSEENKLDIYNYMHDNSYKLLDIKSLSHIFKRDNKKSH
mgnify:CR=1 FL=1